MTDETKWVAESDWTRQTGDKVRLSNAAGSLEGVVAYAAQEAWGDGVSKIILQGLGLELRSTDWSLFVEAKPEPELPTEPGIWLPLSEPELWPYLLDDAGGWWLLDNDKPSAASVSEVTRYAPFTRLSPEADTARKVIEWMKQQRGISPNMQLFRSAAEHFGVADL